MEKIGFIGAGNMATAIINGVITTGTYPAEQLFVFDVSREKCDAMGQKGVGAFSSAAELVKACDVVFLAVKPQNFAEVLESVKDTVTPQTLFVTIAAGISTGYIKDAVACDCPVISNSLGLWDT